MLEITVYLHEYVYDALTAFGPLTDVVNRVLDAGEQGCIPIENLPPTPPRSSVSCRQCKIIVTNEYYEDLIATHGERSSVVSLRRILYNFVDNELWTELEWKAVSQIITVSTSRYVHSLQRVVSSLTRAASQAPLAHRATIVDIAARLKELICEEQRSDT